MRTTHHYPAEPGAIRSIVAPHMFCLGSYRDMLSQDVAFAGRLLRTAEAALEDALTEWQHSSGPARCQRRRMARVSLERVRLRRGQHDAAFGRLCPHAGRRAAA